MNKHLLKSRLIDKFETLTLHAIVNEVFINSLPFKMDKLSKTDIHELSKYSLEVLESFGSFGQIFNNAFKASLTPKQTDFLMKVQSICVEAAVATADEKIKSASKDDDINEIVDKSAFTKSEYNKFVNNAKTIPLEEIETIIKNKTLTVIKDEGEAYKRQNELNEELNNAISTSDNLKEETLESFLDIFLAKTDHRHYTSFFSKLQDICMENLLYSPNEEYTNIPFNVLRRATFKNGLEQFRDSITLSTVIESATAYDPTADVAMNKETVLNNKIAATSCGVIMYTIFETLRTLNLFSPSKEDIQKFVDTPTAYSILIKNNINEFNSTMKSMLKSKRDQISMAQNYEQISDIIDELITARDQLSQINPESFKMNHEQVTGDIDNVLNYAIGKKEGFINSHPSAKQATESFFSNRCKEYDLAEFNKLNMLYKNHPNIKELRFKLNPNDKTINQIAIECATLSGAVIDKNILPISFKTDDILGYIKETFAKSNLAANPNPSYIYYNDGSGKKIKL